VDILPGMTDPANVALPQQPFHPCIFPHSSRFSSLERVPNPSQFKLDNISILGHSGQPVNDITRQSYENNTTDGSKAVVMEEVVETEPELGAVPLQTMDTMETDLAETIIYDLEPKAMKIKSNASDGERRMNILQQTLEWGHLAPTIPGKNILV
jgi:DNA polymerase II small subunit/DNA polymerase delta subunit B